MWYVTCALRASACWERTSSLAAGWTRGCGAEQPRLSQDLGSSRIYFPPRFSTPLYFVVVKEMVKDAGQSSSLEQEHCLHGLRHYLHIILEYGYK